MRYLYLWSLLVLLGNCQNQEAGQETVAADTPAPAAAIDSAKIILDQVIPAHGGDFIHQSRIEFDFRGRSYVAERDGGDYQYERIFEEKNGDAIRDVLTNTTFYRERNGAREHLSARDSSAYANSVNSVIYFALLPYFLNDAAVQASYLGRVTVKGQPYYKIKVTFQQDGGGKDFEDEYIYWFNCNTLAMNYLAYNYQVDGGGARFREAYNIRNIEGIRFADYRNMKPIDGSMKVEEFDTKLEKGELKELSLIETENVRVTLNPEK
jgi:hypothetical protein